MDLFREGGCSWQGPDPGKDGTSMPPSGLGGNDKGSKTTPQKAEGAHRGWDGWVADMSLSKLRELVMDTEAWHA